jgi:hypothetical protein
MAFLSNAIFGSGNAVDGAMFGNGVCIVNGRVISSGGPQPVKLKSRQEIDVKMPDGKTTVKASELNLVLAWETKDGVLVKAADDAIPDHGSVNVGLKVTIQGPEKIADLTVTTSNAKVSVAVDSKTQIERANIRTSNGAVDCNGGSLLSATTSNGAITVSCDEVDSNAHMSTSNASIRINGRKVRGGSDFD